jgi:hypothetical protein
MVFAMKSSIEAIAAVKAAKHYFETGVVDLTALRFETRRQAKCLNRFGRPVVVTNHK